MRTTLLRLAGAAAALTAVATLAGPATSPASAAVHADHTEQAATRTTTAQQPASARSAREPLSAWHCGKWRGNTTTSARYCARLTSIQDKVKVDYRERFQNTGDQSGSLTCSYQKTTTWTESASVSGKVEEGVIFAKVEVSATAGVQHATSTTQTASVTYTQKPHSWAYCERGIHGFTYTGTIRRQLCSSHGCIYDNVQDFRGSAPSAGFWRYGDGRGGVEITPR